MCFPFVFHDTFIWHKRVLLVGKRFDYILGLKREVAKTYR